MNKAFRLGVVSVGIAIMLFFSSAPNAKAQGVLREILNRMDTMNKSLVSLKADVRMDKFEATLGDTDTSTGTTSYLPKTSKRVMYARIDWAKPAVENIVVIGDSYRLYRPRLNQVIEGKVDKASKNSHVPGNALAFMSMSKAQLQDNYTVNYIGQETANGTLTWHLELVPKVKTSYKTAELWVDPNGMPIQSKIIEQNNDSTTIVLSNIQKNVTINAQQEFQLNLPANVKKVQA
jgi:outer membrane lipoprotein-sorting protein